MKDIIITISTMEMTDGETLRCISGNAELFKVLGPQARKNLYRVIGDAFENCLAQERSMQAEASE